MTSRSSTVSVIIPAHNEEAVIGRCLDALLARGGSEPLDVVVVCNGCTDRTADVARQFGPLVHIVELELASKSAALNAGDDVATGWPRVYLDADVVVDRRSVQAIADALETGDPLAASPELEMDYSASGLGVRCFYAVWTRLPYNRAGGIGTGCYALSREARQRFERFPDVIADDGFVRMSFTSAERGNVMGARSRVTAPATLGGLIKIKTRSRLGNYELRRRFPELAERERRDKAYLRAAMSTLTRPWLWPAVPVYMIVNVIARLRARRRQHADLPYAWERDEGSRNHANRARSRDRAPLPPPSVGSSHGSRRYVVVSPVRDEEAYIEGAIRSMAAQSQRPVRWVIVDDGSTDRTAKILDAAAEAHDWIRIVHRSDRGFRQAGTGVIEAFYDGFELIDATDWDYVVKLDGDLSFDPAYFDRCFERFETDTRLGIGGGVILNRVDGRLEIERVPRFHVRGATKIYRRACWMAIGGLVRAPGWDTLDEVHANMLGWETRSFEDVQLTQERFTGDAAGQWSNWVKNGRGGYLSGYHPLYVLVRAARRLLERPYVVASFGIVWGYLGACAKREPRVAHAELRRYLRGQQLRRMLGMRSIWR